MVLLLQAEKVAKKMKANAVSGYSNDSNPFGDPNLTEKYAHSPPSSDNIAHCIGDACFTSRNLGWHLFAYMLLTLLLQPITLHIYAPNFAVTNVVLLHLFAGCPNYVQFVVHFQSNL